MKRQFTCYLKSRAYHLTVNVFTNDESEIKTLALQRASEVMREVGRPEITDYEVVAVVEKRNGL